MPFYSLRYLLLLPILAIYLYAGLNGLFDDHTNTVQHMQQSDALKFSAGSRAYSTPKYDVLLGTEYELEFNILPSSQSYQTGGIIFTLSNGDKDEQITLWQWKNQLIFMKGDDFDFSRRLPRIYLNLPQSPPLKTMIKVQIKSDGETTKMLAYNKNFTEKRTQGFALPIQLPKANLTLANDLALSSRWSGHIHSVELAASAPSPTIKFSAMDATLDHTIPNKGSYPITLNYDTPHQQLKHYFFESISKRLHQDDIGIKDMIINLLGFMPLGILIFFFKPQQQRMASNAISAIAFSFLLSFAIELTQVWIPGRNSSQMDLSLNTIGGLIGWISAFLCCTLYSSLISKQAKM